MKNLFKFLMAVAVLFTASCAKEDVSTSIAGGEVEVSFTANLADLGTRADENTKYTLRYFVFDQEGNELTALSNAEGVEMTTNSSRTVNLVLIKGMKYDITFWADVNKCYSFEEGQNGKVIAIDYRQVTTNAENRDAFFAAKNNFDPAQPDGTSVTLTRPFAQLNTITNDMTAVNNSLSLESIKVTIDAYSKLNLLNGEVVGNPETVTLKEGAILNKETGLLSSNFFLAPSDKYTATVALTIDNSKDVAISGTTYTYVPFKRNYKTNIIGNLLTGSTAFNVSIDANWNTAEHYIYEAFQNGGEVTLTEDIVIAEPLVVAAGKSVVLNLNGCTITAGLKEEGRHHYAIDNYGSLTIVGEGAINARGIENFGTMIIDGNVTITNLDTNGGSAIWNEGTLTINKGTFTTNSEAGVGSYGSALNTQSNGVAVVNGGTFIANSQLTYAIINEGTTTINNAVVKGKHGAVAGAGSIATNIYGGSFELMENPDVSDHCVYCVSAIYGGTFTLGNNTDCGAQVFYESNIAEGYSTIKVDNDFVVVPGTGNGVLVSNVTDFNTDNNNAEITLIVMNGGEYGTIVAKSNKTYSCINNAKVDCINLNGANNVTIKNITFDAANAKLGYDKAGNAKQYANIITGDKTNNPDKGACDLVIDGCTFTGTFDNGGAAIAFTDQKRASGFSGNITIKNCTFDTVRAYYDIYGHYTGDGLNGHGNFVIENNTFKSATQYRSIYLGRYASSTPVVVKGNAFETVNSLENAVALQDHSNYGVSINAEGNTFAQ